MIEIDRPNALVIGGYSTIGKAIAEELGSAYRVFTLSRKDTDYSVDDLARHRQVFAGYGSFSRIVCCLGVLQNDSVGPEKKLADITAEKLAEYFYINSILPMLCLQGFYSLLAKPTNQDTKTHAVFACLSAMVGSIEGNNLGGWYGYRSSKAALNMLVKTTAIEVHRTNKSAIIAAIHPGTTVSDLSKPFEHNIDKTKYYTAERSAKRICNVMDQLQPSQTGNFFNWDGSRIAW